MRRKALEFSENRDVSLSVLYKYSLKRVPELYQNVYSNSLDSMKNLEQHPSLFDFGSRSFDPIILSSKSHL